MSQLHSSDPDEDRCRLCTEKGREHVLSLVSEGPYDTLPVGMSAEAAEGQATSRSEQICAMAEEPLVGSFKQVVELT